MARKKKIKGIVINNFKLHEKEYKIGESFTTTDEHTFGVLIDTNKIKKQ